MQRESGLHLPLYHHGNRLPQAAQPQRYLLEAADRSCMGPGSKIIRK